MTTNSWILQWSMIWKFATDSGGVMQINIMVEGYDDQELVAALLVKL